MAEPSSPAPPGDVSWLPGPGGARLLRIHPAAGDPPTLILRLADGSERQIEASAAEFVIPSELHWSAAWLRWPDGTRVALPLPHGPHAEVIPLHPRRFARSPAGSAPPPAGFSSAPATSSAADPAPSPTFGSAPATSIAAGAPPAPPEGAAPAWTTPPQSADSSEDAEAAWRERRDDLRRELAEAADAIARAREGERSARDAVLTALAAARADLRASRAAREAEASSLTAVTGELEAERAAHAVTRGSVGTLADALAAARAELTKHKTRSEAELAAVRAELAAVRATSAAELADARRAVIHARAEATSVREALEAERALRERPAPLATSKADLERRAREQAEAAAIAARRPPAESAQLLANLEAAAAALRAGARPLGEESSPPASTPEPLEAGAASAAASPSASVEAAAATPPEPLAPSAPATDAARAALEPATPSDAVAFGLAAPSAALVAAGSELWLRRALVALARTDSASAGALLVGLLPAQGAVLGGALSYDITVRGVGTFAVFVEGDSARIVRQSRRRPRSDALFHLSAEPLVLAELLAGERDKVRRFGRRAKVSGRRRRLAELAPLRDARISLADAVKAGARLEPGLVYRALPHAIDPQWTRGHTFTVAQRITELEPQVWHISARDGLPLRVAERRTEARADAIVTMTQAAFERMLRNEPPADGDRPQVRGDRTAVAALKRWTDLARGG